MDNFTRRLHSVDYICLVAEYIYEPLTLEMLEKTMQELWANAKPMPPYWEHWTAQQWEMFDAAMKEHLQYEKTKRIQPGEARKGRRAKGFR